MEFLSWQAELGAKEYLGLPAPGQGHEGHAFLQVAVAGQQRERCLDEGLRIQRDEVGLVLVDALVVSGIDRAGFFWIESEVGETLTGAHLSGARDQVVWVDLADRGLRGRSWRQKTGRQTETLPPWKGRYSSNCQRPI
jgi:hypothetical protein